MARKSWCVCAALSVGSLVASACDAGNESNMAVASGAIVTNATTGTASTTGTAATGTAATGTAATSTAATGTAATSTASTGTTGTTTATVTGTGTATSSASSSSGTGGASSTAATTGEGAPPEPPSCEEIPTRAFGAAFTVSSTEFASCMPMPEATTCEGKLFPESSSPAVNWTAGPEGTLSYAVTFTDLTILATRDPADNEPYNQGYHYVIWDIPAATLGIPANMSSGFEPAEIPGAKQWAPFNDYGYMGPCPNMPPEDGVEPPPLNNDTYSFTVYAMDLATLPVPAVVADGPSFPRVMDDYLKVNALAAAEYRGTSNAQASSTEGVFPPMFEVPCPSTGEPPENCLSAE